MTMVCGLDLHRRQITFDALEVESGQVWTGRVWQPDRERFRRWLRDDVTERAHGGAVSIAVEGCTGWRYVVEEVVAAGFEAHLAEPADTQAARGRKRRAKTDRSDCRLLRELLAGRPVAGVVDPADDRVGVARTGAAVQDVGRSTLDVGAADPRRAVSARGDAAGDVDPLGEDTRAARRRRTRDQSGRPATGPDGVSDDRRHHHRVAPVEGRPATLRPPSAGLSGAGRAPVRDRRAVGGGDVVRARRLPTLHPFRAGGAPQRPGRDRRPVGSATRRRVHLPSRPADVALGALRSSQERLASTQPRPRLLHATSKSTSTASWPPSRWPASSPGAASTSCEPSTPTSSTRRPDTFCRGWWSAPPTYTSRVVSRSAPATGVPASIRAGRPSNIDATADPPSWGTPNQRCCRRRRVRRAPR